MPKLFDLLMTVKPNAGRRIERFFGGLAGAAGGGVAQRWCVSLARRFFMVQFLP
jgi:hypothetical protein